MEKNLTDTPTSERPGQDNADVLIILPGQDTGDVLKDDQTELSNKIKSTEISQVDSEDKDNEKFHSDENIDESSLSEPKGQTEKFSDSIKHENLSQMDASMDHVSNSQEGTLSNDIKKVDEVENRDEGNNFEPKPEEQLKQTTRENYGDSVEHDDLGEMDASMDLDSKSQRANLSNDIEQVDHCEKRAEGKNFKPEPEEEGKQTVRENCDLSIEHDDLVEMHANVDLDSKSHGILSNDIEQVDQAEKMDEGNHFDSKPEEEIKQTIRGKSGDESDPVFDVVEVPEMEANRNSILHTSEADEIMEENMMEISRKKALMEKNVSDTPTTERLGQDNVDVLKYDPNEQFEEIKSEISYGDSELEKDNRKFDTGGNIDKISLSESHRQIENFGDSIKHDNFGEMEASMDHESKSREETLSNDFEQVDEDEKRDQEKNFEPKPEEERKRTTGENCGNGIEHDGFAEKDASIDLDSKSRGNLSNDIGQVDRGEKMDEGKNIEFKPEEKMNQTTGESCGEEETDSVFEGVDVPKLGANRSSSSHSSGPDALMERKILEITSKEEVMEKNTADAPTSERAGQATVGNIEHDNQGKMEGCTDTESKSQEVTLSNDIEQVDQDEKRDERKNIKPKPEEESKQSFREDGGGVSQHDNMDEMDTGTDREFKSREVTLSNDIEQVDQGVKMDEGKNFESEPVKETKQTTGINRSEESDPVVNAAEDPKIEANRSRSLHFLGADAGNSESVQPEKTTAFRNLVKGKGIIAVSTFLRAFSGKFTADGKRDVSDSANDREAARASPKIGDKSAWNPLNYIISLNADAENKIEGEAPEPIVMKGRIILYTRLGCQSCKEVRSFLYDKRLRYVEINIDVYPSRKAELEKFTGSCVVPKVFFNEIVIGGLSELKSLDESGKLGEKIDFLITEEPAYEAPLPPLSGEDDMSSSGTVDELALVVRKMKECIVVKDRFYKMRRFSKCFLGSEAVNFLSEDQYLEREEAIEFGRKLASKLFFQHVLDENLFEDGNNLYWFMDDNPNLSSQCHNIPRGIIEAKPKPIREIASRLRFLSNAIYEAYTSEDGKHVDYRTIHGSEEFARYLRIIQELQRVEFQDIPREEKLAFFINLFNMMIIHAILVLGHPDGATERKKFLGDFKYVIGGYPYSLSAIQNGILRCNQRPPFAVMKPFGNDKFFKAVLPYPEPLIHFALCLGTRSGPALRCYSPGNIDKELMDSARDFLRGGGLTIDLDAKVAYLSRILKWFSMDFGENEVEVLKHASNYLEPSQSEALLELLQDGQLKVIYQPYDWGLNL